MFISMVIQVFFGTLAFGTDFSTYFGGLTADEKPQNITRNNHYVVSNEAHQYIFQSSISNKGGILVGVGSEQLYTFAGWMKPEILIPMDFDQYIVDLHKVYGILFQKASTPDEFVALWEEENAVQVEKWVAEQHPEDTKGIYKVFRFGRHHVWRHLRKLQIKNGKAGVQFFLNNQEMYDFCVSLHREGRVFSVRGDLTKAVAMKSISQASKKAKIPVQMIYLSNAEQYFPYDSVYRNNFIQMNFSSDAVVLRTLPKGKDYRYFIQESRLFKKYLESEKYPSIWKMVKERESIPDTEGRGFLLPHAPKFETSK